MPSRPDRDPRGLEVGTRRLTTDAGQLFDPAERPAQPPQSENLLFPVVSQDVGHADGQSTRSPVASTSWGATTSLAGFQVSTTDLGPLDVPPLDGEAIVDPGHAPERIEDDLIGSHSHF